ncbi:MAG: hypothetical protein A4E65_01219 [Syntrophorhabdus sp. PtaU1.Bin153]|nr:MAG: hypothetical protein A4E65_01219 [Syntrophorhabdus sp. PtaU1.Bin153]
MKSNRTVLQPLAQMQYSQEHCFASCRVPSGRELFPAPASGYPDLEVHSISQARPVISGLRHANCPPGRFFSPTAIRGTLRRQQVGPKNARRRDSRKVLPALCHNHTSTSPSDGSLLSSKEDTVFLPDSHNVMCESWVVTGIEAMFQMWMRCKSLLTAGVLNVCGRTHGEADRRRWTLQICRQPARENIERTKQSM